MRYLSRLIILLLLALTLVDATASSAQQPDSAMYSSLRWRMIGPFRAGRTVAAVGIAKANEVDAGLGRLAARPRQ